MCLIFCPIFVWIRSAGRHVRSRLVLGMVTVSAFDREDAMPIRSTPQAEGGMRTTIFALQRRISRRVTVDASWMHEYLVSFQKCRTRPGIIARRSRASEGVANGHKRNNAQERAEQTHFNSSHRNLRSSYRAREQARSPDSAACSRAFNGISPIAFKLPMSTIMGELRMVYVGDT